MNQRLAVCLATVVCLAALVGATPVTAASARLTERVSPAPQVNPNAVVWRTPQPPAKPEAGDVWVNPKDEMELVYVSPGEFTLGTSDAQIDAWLKERPGDKRDDFADEQPQCRVNLPGYWIGRTEVTNAQYLGFVKATGHRAPQDWERGQVPAGLEDFPVVWVSWKDADAYCEWAGGHLPTELQWEKAARGIDGRVYPWGNQWDSKRCRNLELITGKTYASGSAWVSTVGSWLAYHGPRDGPAAVGSYPPGVSPYGCADMAGNVWEWCADWYDKTAYQRYAKGHLTSPADGTYKVVRGGSWDVDPPRLFRCAARYGLFRPVDRDDNCGFRCARDASP